MCVFESQCRYAHTARSLGRSLLFVVVFLIPRLHDEAGSTSWLYERSSSQLVEPASSCKRGITFITSVYLCRLLLSGDTTGGGGGDAGNVTVAVTGFRSRTALACRHPEPHNCVDSSVSFIRLRLVYYSNSSHITSLRRIFH